MRPGPGCSSRGLGRRGPRRSSPIIGVAVLTVSLLGQLIGPSPADAADIAVPLGSAASYSVLGVTGVTNTLTTDLSGDLGVSPAGLVVGFPPGIVGGQTHNGDLQAAQAHADLLLAYDDAAGRTPTGSFAGDLNGRSFSPGVYDTAAALALTGTLTLDGGGDPDAVFIFQVDAALNTAAASMVTLTNGARASHVFWQVNGAAGLGAASSFSGTIMAAAAITVGAGAVVAGRVLSYGGAVTLAANTISTPPTVTITGGPAVYTDDTTPTIAGTADAAPGETVTVTVAGQTMKTTVSTSGAWSVTPATVPAGWYYIVASVTGPAGNTDSAQQTLTVGATTAVALGSAGTYSVLADTGVSNTGITHLSGDLGLSPEGSLVGFPPGIVSGQTHNGDAQAAQAQADLVLAYHDAARRSTPNANLPGDLNGLTLYPGVYRTAPAAALALTGTVTLDGGGDANAVFIFQVDAALNTAAASSITLTNGAQASGVFWQVNGAAGLGASSSFSGTIMAAAAITVGAGAIVAGGVLSCGGAVTLSANAVNTPATLAGALSITVPASAINLGTYAIPTGGETITSRLGTVQVDDTRGGSSGAGWVVTITATAFTMPSGPSLAASSVSYSAGPIIQIQGTATITDDHPGDLTAGAPAVTATGMSGENAAATIWNPTISVTVPGGIAAGVYTATITQTVV
jgi:Ice-binding-like/Bacterial Ig-like domain